MPKLLGLFLAGTALLTSGCDYNNDGPLLPDAGTQSSVLDAGARASFVDAANFTDGRAGGHDRDAASSFDSSDARLSVVLNASFESALTRSSRPGACHRTYATGN